MVSGWGCSVVCGVGLCNVWWDGAECEGVD